MIKLNPDDWWLSGPDEEGFVYLRWEDAGPDKTVRLGTLDAAGEKMADFLGQNDFGERPPA